MKGQQKVDRLIDPRANHVVSRAGTRVSIDGFARCYEGLGLPTDIS